MATPCHTPTFLHRSFLCPILSRPAGGHPWNVLMTALEVAARTIGGLRPFSTPLDTPSRTPLVVIISNTFVIILLVIISNTFVITHYKSLALCNGGRGGWGRRGGGGGGGGGVDERAKISVYKRLINDVFTLILNDVYTRILNDVYTRILNDVYTLILNDVYTLIVASRL